MRGQIWPTILQLSSISHIESINTTQQRFNTQLNIRRPTRNKYCDNIGKPKATLAQTKLNFFAKSIAKNFPTVFSMSDAQVRNEFFMSFSLSNGRL